MSQLPAFTAEREGVEQHQVTQVDGRERVEPLWIEGFAEMSAKEIHGKRPIGTDSLNGVVRGCATPH